MNKKKEIIDLYYEGEHIIYTRELFDNIISIFEELGMDGQRMAAIGKIPLATFKGLKRMGFEITTSSKIFIYNSFYHLLQPDFSRVHFNSHDTRFYMKDTTSPKQFKNGTYYGYFKSEELNEIIHFVLLIDGLQVEMWSRPKQAKGILVLDNNTYSFILKSTVNKKNYEFYLGNNSDNADLKYFVALWRNSNNIVKCGVCMVKYMGKRFGSFEDIKNSRKTLREEMEKAMPYFGSKFFKKDGKSMINYDITGYETEH
ncbi:hypothetical protein EZ428_21275 [Pedobacter frigiditerrae]|uniref:Uncharacterized protein n=1 Tax=Pedobacter frigiditerrae TaxID=2530452 RepID=A0A4R0MKU6_9SPHI|nr:hypothetical protein [Pedobacter frigiditerrae]TCC87240.1 hypothetical protein EZ428_21275 [Pedobacter frigiditerrae]